MNASPTSQESENLRKKALTSMQNLCSKAEKCKQEIRNKLILQKMNPSDIEWVIKNLEAEKFIDEHRYTSFYVRDKFRFNKWGKIKIRYNLRGKEIPDEIIRPQWKRLTMSNILKPCWRN